MKIAPAAVLTPLLIVAFALAGCAKAPASEAKDCPSASPCHVEMSSSAFEPREITIKKGGTVHWMFKGTQQGVQHDVTSENSQFQSSAELQQGTANATHQYTFNNVGTFKYRCTFHSSNFDSLMSGKVIVVA